MRLKFLYEGTITTNYEKDIIDVPSKFKEVIKFLLAWQPKYDTSIPVNAGEERFVMIDGSIYDSIVIDQIKQVGEGYKPAAMITKEYLPFTKKYNLDYSALPDTTNIVVLKKENSFLFDFFRFAYGNDMKKAARHYLLGLGLGYPHDKVLEFINMDKPPIR